MVSKSQAIPSPDPLPDLIHAKPICLGVVLRDRETERVNEMTIDEGVLRGDLGSGAPSDLAANATGFHQRNRQTGLTEEIGGGNADDPRADDDHVKGLRACQSRICSFGRCRSPATIRLAGKAGSAERVGTDC